MIGTDSTFAAALDVAQKAVDAALQALDTVDTPDTSYVLPLMEAQKNLKTATREWRKSGHGH